MRLLTCGSNLEVPDKIMAKFDGVSGGYYWTLWGSPDLQAIAQKYGKSEIWCNFLYGHRNQTPDPSSGTYSIEEWVTKRVANYPYVTHWNLINEFINDRDKFNPYPNYEYADIRKYILAAKAVNPSIKVIISDFRPYQLERWQKIKAIIEQLLTEEIPIDGVGIQVHCKTSNAHTKIPFVPYMLDALPLVIQMFDGVVPVHISEASMWRHYSEPQSKVTKLWKELLTIAESLNVESFTPWWLVEPWDKVTGVYDNKLTDPMPTFQEFRGAGIYGKDWVKQLDLTQV